MLLAISYLQLLVQTSENQTRVKVELAACKTLARKTWGALVLRLVSSASRRNQPDPVPSAWCGLKTRIGAEPN